MKNARQAFIRKAIRDQCDTLPKTTGRKQLFDDEFHRKERERYRKIRLNNRLKRKPMRDHLERLLAELIALRMLHDKTGNVRFALYRDLTQAEAALISALEKCD